MYVENTRFRTMRRLWSDDSGQDLIEYALISGFVAVVVAGFLPPSIMPAVSSIFSRINSSMAAS